MGSERARLGAWAPGRSGKGFLLAGDPPLLRLWRTDPRTLSPHHAEAIETLKRSYADVAAFITIMEPNLLFVTAGCMDEAEATMLIVELDPRLAA